jgi:predicted lysophospholipase L1 biosynthesis ABC-type transport system permease subunit
VDSQDLVRSNLKNPLGGVGWRGLVALSLVAGLVLAAIILVLYGVVVINDSKVDLAVVKVLGMSARAPWTSIVCEFIVIVILGTAAGFAAGMIMARWTLSWTDFTPGGYPLSPPYSVGMNWWLSLILVVGITAVAFTAIVFTGRRAARQRASEVLRLGN